MKKTFFFLFFLLLGIFHFSQSPANFYLDIKKFGVKGDGKSDDSDALQKAIIYCENNSVKSLFIPDGKYLIKKSIVFKKGGLQLIGTGALLREESWQASMGREFSDHQPFLGCTFIIDRNIEGFVFSKTVADPVRISNIQFFANEGRKEGQTTALSFKSEFKGPVWPFIVEYCNFRGFNYAIKFESSNQYCVAFIQIRNNAFSQNDECIYFGDTKIASTAGMRNLSWGFDFEYNKCHDNSRIIRGCFAKDPVNIRYNNMEGNIPYSTGKTPTNIVDIEVSNATVNFEGNHFESVISDCVYISSAFKDSNGNYLPYSGKTTSSSENKIFIKGNNFDGIDALKFKPFIMKAMIVFNYDSADLYLDESDVRENKVNNLNLKLSDFARTNGTIIKLPVFVYEKSFLAFEKQYRTKSCILKEKAISSISPVSGINFIPVDKNTSLDIFENIMEATANESFFGATFIINNGNSNSFFGTSLKFIIEYFLNGKRNTKIAYVNGNYGTVLGYTVLTGYLPNPVPSNAKDIRFKVQFETSHLGSNTTHLASKYELFTFTGNNLWAIPVFR